MSAISIGKDLYLLEFGASPKVMGVILLACSFVSPLMDSMVGNLQDKGAVLWRCFPATSWGRRAPWLLTHSLFLAPLLWAFFLPPSYERKVLHGWFLAVWLIGYWCVAASTNAFEAARVEIYPFKEERVSIESYCKLTVASGVGIGTGASFLCLTFPHKPMFVMASLVGFLAVLSSIAAVDVLREARSEKGSNSVTQELGSVLRSPMVLRMMVLRALQGIYETIMPALQLYYYTFVFKMDRKERLFWFGLGGFLIGIVELGLAPVWARMFTRSTTLMLYVPLALRVFEAFAAPLMLLTAKDIRLFLAYLVIWRLCNSSYSYWRISACGWICDREGGDREGLLLGFFTMVNNLGRAVTSAVAVLGLGWAGLVTSNCLQHEGPERDACEHEKIHFQPESLRAYLEIMIAVVAPVVELVICGLTYEFPIRPGSKVLEDLCRKQAEALSSRKSADEARSQAPGSQNACAADKGSSPTQRCEMDSAAVIGRAWYPEDGELDVREASSGSSKEHRSVALDVS